MVLSQFIFINNVFFLVSEELTSQSSQGSSEPTSITELHSVTTGLSHISLNPSGPLLHPSESSPNPHQPTLEHLHPCLSTSLEYDPAPIQNSPWKESSLDQPYQKQKKTHSSRNSSWYVNLRDLLMEACSFCFFKMNFQALHSAFE